MSLRGNTKVPFPIVPVPIGEPLHPRAPTPGPAPFNPPSTCGPPGSPHSKQKTPSFRTSQSMGSPHRPRSTCSVPSRKRRTAGSPGSFPQFQFGKRKTSGPPGSPHSKQKTRSFRTSQSMGSPLRPRKYCSVPSREQRTPDPPRFTPLSSISGKEKPADRQVHPTASSRLLRGGTFNRIPSC
jgi:hypothetical protein